MSESNGTTQYSGWFWLRYRISGGELTHVDDVRARDYGDVGGRIPIAEMLGNFDILAMAHAGEIPDLPREPRRGDIVRCQVTRPRAMTVDFLLVDLRQDSWMLKPTTPGGKVKVQHRPGYPCALWRLPSPLTSSETTRPA